MKKLVIVALLLSGCASNPVIDKNLNLKYANSYGDEYCPTSGMILVGGLTGTSAVFLGGVSAATGGIVALAVGAVIWSNTGVWENSCFEQEEKRN